MKPGVRLPHKIHASTQHLLGISHILALSFPTANGNRKHDSMIVPLTLSVCRVKINPLPRKSMALTDAKTS